MRVETFRRKNEFVAPKKMMQLYIAQLWHFLYDDKLTWQSVPHSFDKVLQHFKMILNPTQKILSGFTEHKT